ncbi:hypothetical protein CDAR_564331 [Caerostris darwini]|uniref:Uncharacterized protein n=1 Tax=Caerostris darwini TaxID=1538125 RepID=A0AAV4PRN2_9ARAC|nr:hypothetical protein CDAR_564331 [Caerostris darwini]
MDILQLIRSNGFFVYKLDLPYEPKDKCRMYLHLVNKVDNSIQEDDCFDIDKDNSRSKRPVKCTKSPACSLRRNIVLLEPIVIIVHNQITNLGKKGLSEHYILPYSQHAI